MKRGPKKASPIVTTEVCSYGCGNIAKFISHVGKLICEQSGNSCPENRLKNSKSLEDKHEELRKKNGKAGMYNYDNLPEETKSNMNWNKGKFTGTIFEYDGRGNPKKYLIEERGHRCECCGLNEWMNNPITLELEHVDGDNKNNVKDNLKLLCPNCHSYTETWRGRNITSTVRKNISDEDFLKALDESESIRSALISLGLTPKGGNYERAYRLMYKKYGNKI